jgi:hypothetical protein
VRCLTLLLLIFLLQACYRNEKRHINLTGFTEKNEVIYDTRKARFHFGRDELLAYCKKMNNGEPNRFIYGQLIDYIHNTQGNSIIIPDTLGMKWENTDSLAGIYEKDTLVFIRDNKSPYAYAAEATTFVLLSFIEEGKVKVFDKRKSTFAPFIYLQKTDDDLAGTTRILLPNDSVIFSQLRWIH